MRVRDGELESSQALFIFKLLQDRRFVMSVL